MIINDGVFHMQPRSPAHVSQNQIHFITSWQFPYSIQLRKRLFIYKMYTIIWYRQSVCILYYIILAELNGLHSPMYNTIMYVHSVYLIPSITFWGITGWEKCDSIDTCVTRFIQNKSVMTCLRSAGMSENIIRIIITKARQYYIYKNTYDFQFKWGFWGAKLGSSLLFKINISIVTLYVPK